jgi:Xaa-Pro aminopeptidase
MTQVRSSTSRRPRRQVLEVLMDRLELGAVLLRRPANFAWYSGGADVLVTPEAEYIFTNNIEAPRMREEQTPSFEVVEHPWYEGETAAIREAVGDAALGTHFPLEGALEVSDGVAPLRYVLDPDILERNRRIGADAAAAVEEAERSLQPGMGEREKRAGFNDTYGRTGGMILGLHWQ